MSRGLSMFGELAARVRVHTLAEWLLACAALLLVLGSAGFEQGLARSTSQRSVGTNAFTTRNLVAPTNLTAQASGHDVQLNWSAGQNGSNYDVNGVANGTSSECSSPSFSPIASTSATAYTDTARYSPQGTYFCYQVKTTYGGWSSQHTNPIVASQIGFVASSVQLINDGNHSACSGSGNQVYGQVGKLDCGDQVVVNFNQPVNPAAGPVSADTVCPSYNGVFLASTTTSGTCDTAVFRVGSFTKSTATGAQTIAHELGTTPKAIILWTNGKTNESLSANFIYAFGVSDGTTSESISAASQDALNTSKASTRIANKAITIVQWGQTLLAEADMSSWDATNFTLNWTTNNATAYVIHFIAIGGSSVSAKVVGWTMPTATGSKAITGVGFKPDVVIHAFPDATFTNAIPASLADATIGLGAMDANGNQWTNFIFSRDGRGTSDTQRGQQTNAAIFTFTNALAVTKKASYVSMDTDGFTVNYSVVNGNKTQIFSLALKGVTAKAGNFNKSTAAAPASQAVTGIGFQPRAVMLSSFQDVAQANAVNESRFGIGASDATSDASSAYIDANNVTTTITKGIDKTSKVFVKVNNNTPTIDAEANLTSMDSGGFTLNWTTNDAVATQLVYLALAPKVAAGETLDLGQLTGGIIGGCNCRFNASYAWSSGNKTLTLTIGTRTVGYTYPTIGLATWTFNPTTSTSKLLSQSGAFHICDTNSGGGNCLPATSAGATTFAAQSAQSNDSLAPAQEAAPEVEQPQATKTRKPKTKPTITPTPQPTNTPTAKPTRVKRKPTVTPTSTAIPAECAATPDAPVVLKPKAKATLTATRARLEWGPVKCASAYQLIVRQDTRQGAKVYDVTQTETGFLAEKLARGKIYFWRVKACNDFGCSASAWNELTIRKPKN